MSAKLLYAGLLLIASMSSNAALDEESPEVIDTDIVLLQANTSLGETQINLVKGFIETTLSLTLNLNASKAGQGAFRYSASREILESEQQLVTNTLPATYEVSVSFPIDTTTYKPRPDDEDSGGMSTLRSKIKEERK
ncbi:hypothetical protein DZA50_04275 [Kangiella sp. HD9-110m-PIT-SAG07]|nr:hypothetical protein DZA50_04275 [Kangiella sp. HD9-110m-PIT-SAG07]